MYIIGQKVLYIMNFGQMYVELSGIIKEPLYICQLRVIYACCINSNSDMYALVALLQICTV